MMSRSESWNAWTLKWYSGCELPSCNFQNTPGRWQTFRLDGKDPAFSGEISTISITLIASIEELWFLKMPMRRQRTCTLIPLLHKLQVISKYIHTIYR